MSVLLAIVCFAGAGLLTAWAVHLERHGGRE